MPRKTAFTEKNLAENQLFVSYGKYAVVVQEASILMATKRFRLMNETARSFGIKKGDKLDVAPAGVDPDEYEIKMFSWPNLVSATVWADGMGWPLSYEEFAELPAAFWDLWSEAVRKANPSWYSIPEETEENLPKGETPPTQSTTG